MKKDENRLSMLDWYIKVLTEREIKVDVNEITSEAVELGIDKVDLYFLPEEEFKKLPPTQLFETYGFEDTDGSYYFGYAILHPETQMEWIGLIRRGYELIDITYLPFSPEYNKQFLD